MPRAAAPVAVGVGEAGAEASRWVVAVAAPYAAVAGVGSRKDPQTSWINKQDRRD